MVAVQALSHAIGRMAAPTMTEITLQCSDGIKLAAQSWTTSTIGDEVEPPAQRRRRQRILCLHGWMDNCRSFHHLAPALLQKLPDIDLIALDFPGHGWSSHKSNDGPPLVLAETAFYVAEAVHQLQWQDESTPFTLIGHSMGAAISCLYAAAFPEQVEKLVLLEGGTLGWHGFPGR